MRTKHQKHAQKTKHERTPEETIARKKKVLKQAKTDIVIKILLFVISVVVTFTVFLGVTTAETDDMYPAIRQGDVIIYSRIGDPMNSEVVLYEADGKQRIGRVQAEAGALINKTKGNLLTINGNIQPIQERAGLFFETQTKDRTGLKLPSTVPNGAYLVLGDKREGATDSRDLGYIQNEQIKGKVFTILRRRAL